MTSTVPHDLPSRNCRFQHRSSLPVLAAGSRRLEARAVFRALFFLSHAFSVTDPAFAMPAIVIAAVRWSIGFAFVAFLAGLHEIPDELYEAGRADGAGHRAVLRHIILSGLRRTTTFIVVMQIVLHFQVFGQSHLITGGGPHDETQVLVRHIHQTAIRDSELGYALALAIFLFMLMLVFSLLQLRIRREQAA